ncbi:cupin [Pseudalkalibacillus caeni]|uniref:Cupin n=1 Tax=Exobacillus caeni TaxID=2574798 RepID=A0A5R9F791_9BACL|nr:cupin [Pseudalkalibacillus caeni]TLS38130.1 cupin [Pseudalkalibacillus caeni]
MHIQEQNIVGEHDAVVNQLFLVVSGSGWVAGENGKRIPIEQGQAAFWIKGETHTSGSEEGMTVIVLEGEDIVPSPMMKEID